MNRLMLISAAATAVALAAPAAAQSWNRPPPNGFHDGFHDGFRDGHRDRDHRDFRRDRRDRDGDSFFFTPEAWAYYNNRGWQSDSYNDWWHDRTDRAYPRWVQEQRRSGSCSPDRVWWSGSGWHC
jgi:hypothetical protein